jgi:hypothetical protein
MTCVTQLRSRCKSIEDFDAAREGVDPLFKVRKRRVWRLIAKDVCVALFV